MFILDKEDIAYERMVSDTPPVGYGIGDDGVKYVLLSKEGLVDDYAMSDIFPVCCECDEPLFGRQVLDRVEFGRMVGISLMDIGCHDVCDYCVPNILRASFSLTWIEGLDADSEEYRVWHMRQANALRRA